MLFNIFLVFCLIFQTFSFILITFAQRKLKLFMAGIYLHIPFCQRRCVYCDFFSSVDSSFRGAYVDALCRELEMRSGYLGGEEVGTVYMGGGTPSQLSLDELDKLFSYMYKVYRVSSDAEVTMEANPDDMSEEYVKAIATVLPVNRISMGVQTFHDGRLAFLRRRHTSVQALEAVERCRKAGITNLSIDLIYGLPGETLEEWEDDLTKAIALRVPHLSAYHLTYEEGTPLWHMLEKGELEETDEELSLQMYVRLVERLKSAGYCHYEISNFSLPGMESRHNSSYWKGIPYMGCGAAAHSYNGYSRQWNVASIRHYIKGISEGTPRVEVEELDLRTRYNDYMVTALRTRWGISLDYVAQHFGESYRTYCLRMARTHMDNGLLQSDGDVIRLTEQGIFLSDGIISDLLRV